MKLTYHPDFKFRFSIIVMLLYLIVALFAPFIANHKPLACKTKNGWIFPVFIENYNKVSETECIFPIIPYGPQKTNVKDNISSSPFENQEKLTWSHRHWLGTDKLGRDVASGLIHGTKVALQIGFLSVLLAFIIGVSIGMLSAYYKDEGLQINILHFLFLLVSGFIFIFYCVYEWMFSGHHLVKWSLLLVLFLLLNNFIKWLTSKIKWLKFYKFPMDTIVIKIIEIRKSFPGTFILLALTSLFAIPSVWNIVIIITLLGWTEFARFARAETLAVKEENYIKAATILGYDHFRILYKHILPNILPTLIVVACFNISGAILLESTLSFLGIGLPVEQVTWGKMMAEGRSMLQWWMVVFPGMALFIIILCLNTIADGVIQKDSSMH